MIEISEELWQRGIQETFKRVSDLLESIETLLDNGGNKSICGGLYTYALEEYGKSLLLKQCVPSNERVQIDPNWFKGPSAHNRKINYAIANLPSECKTLRRGPFDPRVFDPSAFDTEDVVADFEARKDVFFMGFSDSYDSIKPVPLVDEELLRKAIQKLRAEASKS